MWRRTYLLLVLVRLYLALSPSYLHPDEHFQGPEVIAGAVLGFPVHRTWEFAVEQPVRSIFPVWLVYGAPLTVLKWVHEGLGYGAVQPYTAFRCLRALMFLLSFVLGDWALHELLPVSRQRRVAILLVASSHVTWTWQTHTFSNSLESVAVLWALVLMRRLTDHTQLLLFRPTCALAVLVVGGLFNRITLPAFLLVPAIPFVRGLALQPLRIPVLLVAGLLTTALAITVDTDFYRAHRRPALRPWFRSAVVTPLNNFAYNSDSANLATHGLHPLWQHFAVNLPQLLGPAFPLLSLSSRRGLLFWSAVVGTVALSCFPHQEPRFLLPAVPLFLASVRVPQCGQRYWIAAWTVFNLVAGLLFGVYHQGGVVPAQTWIAQQDHISHAVWWKTYSPPRWLLDGKNEVVVTTDLMGMKPEMMLEQLLTFAPCEGAQNRTLLVAPDSATALDAYTWPSTSTHNLIFTRRWQHRHHIGLDDLDFGADGVLPTLQRVVGRRGLVVWQVSMQCL